MDQIIDGFGDMIPEKSHEYINKLYGPPDKAYEHSVEELDPVINVVYNRYVCVDTLRLSSLTLIQLRL